MRGARSRWPARARGPGPDEGSPSVRRRRIPRHELPPWVVVLRPGTQDSFIQALQEAGYDVSKVADHPAVLASSQRLEPGKSDTVVVDISAPGSYPYLCSMPGHADIMGMRGVIVVR